MFLGGTWFVTIFQLPQRYQIVNGLSAFQAGIRFIPFTLATPIGSVFAPAICKVFKIPPVYFVMLASALQIVGYVLLSTLPETPAVAARQYGYQIIAGFGCGINITFGILMTPFLVESRDKGTWKVNEQ